MMGLTRPRLQLILSFWIDFRGNPSKKGQISAINYLKGWQHIFKKKKKKGLRGPNYRYIYENGTRIDFTKILRKGLEPTYQEGKNDLLGSLEWGGNKYLGTSFILKDNILISGSTKRL